MRLTSRFLSDRTAASAVEFALVVPVMILFLLGIIDVGRFIWNTNEVEKAVQIGTRWAVATDMIPGADQPGSDQPCASTTGTMGLRCYSFAVNGLVPQGEIVPKSYFPGVVCSGNAAATVSCTCKAGAQCPFIVAPGGDGAAAFTSIAGRMNQIYAGIGNENVQIDYDWSGLGYSGDPFGSDVDPLVTVTVKDVGFRPIFLAGIFDFGLPDLSYTLTMEDGEGAFSN